MKKHNLKVGCCCGGHLRAREVSCYTKNKKKLRHITSEAVGEIHSSVIHVVWSSGADDEKYHDIIQNSVEQNSANIIENENAEI